MNKFTTTIIVIVALGVGIIVGHSFLPHSSIATATNASGTTYGTAKFAGTVINLASAGANGTSTSITNSDATDRYITSWKIGCQSVGTSKTAYTGTGLANLLVSVGTTTASAPASFASDIAIATNFTVPTSTVNLLISSSTLQTSSSANAALWGAGTALTFFFNATNTAVCTVGADYIGS